jgi:hypothetical protein
VPQGDHIRVSDERVRVTEMKTTWAKEFDEEEGVRNRRRRRRRSRTTRGKRMKKNQEEEHDDDDEEEEEEEEEEEDEEEQGRRWEEATMKRSGADRFHSLYLQPHHCRLPNRDFTTRRLKRVLLCLSRLRLMCYCCCCCF